MTTPAVPQKLAPTLEAHADPQGPGGLLALVSGAPVALPLRVVTVRAHLVENIARTTVTQTFVNDLEVPVEAVHIFPLPEDGAVVAMRLTAGDLTVTAECRRREEAEEAFEEARQAGLQAGLLTAEAADVHTLRVTNLPPKTSVQVTLELVETLPSQDGELHWRFPTVIAPRFLPGEPMGHSGPGVHPDTDRVPDASHLQPPLRLEGGAELDLEVTIEGRLRWLRSSLHAVRMDLDDEGGPSVRVAPDAKASLDRDFVLAYALERPEGGMLRAWTDGAFTLLAIDAPIDLQGVGLPRQAVLVVDISGSMGGAKLAAAKVGLKTVMHGLRAGDSFNLIAFDDRLETLSDEPLAYDQESLDRADAWIDALVARGGTEMLPAIQAALAGKTGDGVVRTVVFITDGQAWNADELVAAVHHRRGAARFFTLGIDTAVNSSLLKRLAAAGGGSCTLLTPGEDIRAAVAGLESRIGQPLAESLSLTAGEPADPNLPVLFTGQSATILLKGSPKSLTLKGKTSTGALKEQARPKCTSMDLAPLWARARVAALEDRWAAFPSEREGLRGEIQALALDYGIASRFTAFVAIQRQIQTGGKPVEIVQPVELPQDWSADFLSAPLSLGAPASPGPMPKAHSLRQRIELGHITSSRRAGAEAWADRVPVQKDTYLDLDSRAQAYLLSRVNQDDLRLPPDELERRMHALYSDFLSTNRIILSAKEGERFGKQVVTEVIAVLKQGSLDNLLLRQKADGSWGGDVQATAAALACLILLGHTRLAGDHRQAVRKAHDWLSGVTGTSDVAFTMDMLDQAEGGEATDQLTARFAAGLERLKQIGAEGRALESVLASLAPKVEGG